LACTVAHPVLTDNGVAARSQTRPTPYPLDYQATGPSRQQMDQNLLT